MARKKTEEETKKKKKPGRPLKKETKVEKEPEAPKKRKPGRPPGTGKPIGRMPKPKKKTRALNGPEVMEEKEAADGIGFGDLLFIADDLNNCLEPDPLIDADDDADEDELRKAILDTAELLTDDDIIAAKVFPKGTPTQNRMDSEGGGPYLAIETLEMLQKMGVELPEPLSDNIRRGGRKAAGKKHEAKRAELRERAKAEVRAKLAEEAEEAEDDEEDDEVEEETPKKGKKKRYTRVDSLVDAIKMGPCTKKELAERANMLYMEHGGTDSLVHAKWYVTGIAQVIKELGVDVYTTKK